ncbi:MAG TPA: cadherin domain-containing protein [Aestuariivirga sp.]|nr:cadherin domain-containing protein [Aestuariivirga sp.]
MGIDHLMLPTLGVYQYMAMLRDDGHAQGTINQGIGNSLGRDQGQTFERVYNQDNQQPMEMGTAAGGTSNGTSVGINTGLVNQLDSGLKWNTSTGAIPTTISYGFTTSNSFAAGNAAASGWSAYTETQKTAVRQMMGLWDELIAPTLVESTASPNTADIKFSNTTSGPNYAYGYYPGKVNSETNSWDKIEGSVWTNPAYNSGINNLVSPTLGIYGYMALLHEIGHAMGLEHGGNYNGGSPAYGNTSTGWLYTEDSRQFTIMSYFNASATGANWGSYYAQTPMVYDILAIQQMYGADHTTRAGNTVYGFNSNAGSTYNFTQNTNPILTIWDGSGTDTIDLSGWSTASVLSLVAGSYSSVNGMTKNLAIAFNVDIENATGGSGSDTITGNDLANTLLGNGGNDTINGAGGNDTINGGAGVDTLTGGAGDDTIYFDALDNLAALNGGTGFDTVIQLGVYITFNYASQSFERLLNIISDLGSAAWTQQTDYYDVTNLYYQCDITYDNGTKSVTEYDVYNTETWSSWTVTYAANGSIISQTFVPDGGGGANVAPTITSNGGGATAAVNVAENSTAVTTVTSSDPDAGASKTYSIVGGADAGKFTINGTTGVLSFVSAPDFDIPADTGANNIYDVQVQVSDGALTDTQSLAVTVTNQNEAPTITSNGGGATAAVNVAENSTAVTTVTSSDVDAGASKTYSIVGGADAGKFTINGTTGVLSFVSAPNFEAATDTGANNIYDVQVQVSDGALTDTQSLAVTVTNQNEAPTITSNGGGATAAVNVAENSTAVTTVTSSDPDAGASKTYSIVGGADAAKFTINGTTGVLSFVSAPDFNAPTDAGANNVYDVQVQVSDGALTDTQSLAVTVTNQNVAPVISSNGGGTVAAVNVSENTTAVTTVAASDGDAGTTLAYSIVGGADAAKFTINGTTGVLSFVSAPDFDIPADTGANNIYDVQVQVSDGALTDTQSLAVTVTNQNEAPTITSNGGGASATISVTENTTAVATVTSSDSDAGAPKTFSIVGGADAPKFTINGTTGVLSFVSAPDFDVPTDVGADNVYDVQVQVSDGALTDTQSIAVTVTNQNVAPVISTNGGGATASVTVTENTTAVTTVAASDADAGTTLAYSIIGGADATKFTINATTGVLSFVSTPDFEAPGDAGANNIYDVQVQVSDGALTDTQSLAVTVTNQNEAPTITSIEAQQSQSLRSHGKHSSGAQASVTANSIAVAEGTTAAMHVTATDPDFGTILAYSISGGADASKFSVNATTGVLSFVSAPDFEAPTDADANNVYDVQVQVSDGALTDTQAIAMTVTNVNEPTDPTTINGTSSNNVLTGTAGSNIMNGLAGNDTLAGLGGADTLVGGSGTDTATYAASLAGVNVSLMTGVGTGGDAQGDTLSSIENLTGSNFDDTLEGNAASNVLKGGLGIDTVSYANASNGVTVSLALTSSQNTLGAGLDTLSAFENLTGSAFNDKLTGNSASNTLRGGAGNDILNGALGADTMFGGTGDDTYVVDNVGDLVDETGGSGSDTIQTALAFSLGGLGAIENLTLTGSAAIVGTGNGLGNILTGNAGANLLTGLGGNDTLNGGAGADTMLGGTGSDIYVIDNGADVADETDGDGVDTIHSSITFSLSDALHVLGSIENLTLTGTGAINGTGTAGANIITGNSGSNILAGLGGADQLIGGAGTDTATYVASTAGVNVSLATGLGYDGDAEGDTLATIENLTGSTFDDTLEGSSGTNVLAGGLGIDTLSYANATAGVTVSLATTKAQNTLGAGSDKLSGFENLSGSAFADKLTGNAASNVLRGGAGNDILTGGAGADTFDFSKLTEGNDVVTDFVSGLDDLGLSDLLGTAGLGGRDYATLVAQGHLVVEEGFFATGLSSNSATTVDTRVYFDADGFNLGGQVLIATLEDTLTSAGDFLV